MWSKFITYPVEVTGQCQVEKFCAGKKIYRIMVKVRYKFGSYCFLFKVRVEPVHMLEKRANKEREDEYSREETIVRIIAL